uniref:Putative secreted protein n=1 Tax=Anopheles marajoara TaxID=58244 RepID=A0A2M4C8H7_9DIPT
MLWGVTFAALSVLWVLWLGGQMPDVSRGVEPGLHLIARTGEDRPVLLSFLLQDQKKLYHHRRWTVGLDISERSCRMGLTNSSARIRSDRSITRWMALSYRLILCF